MATVGADVKPPACQIRLAGDPVLHQDALDIVSHEGNPKNPGSQRQVQGSLSAPEAWPGVGRMP
jgi:hypothetical protein